VADAGDVTRLLERASAGDAGARTALVHETFLKLASDHSRFENRAHFLGVAAGAMRRVLVDHARGRNAQKRGSGAPLVTVDNLDDLPHPVSAGVDLVVLDDALSRLTALDARQGQIVELRFFGGLSVEETAAVVGVSERTVKREWQLSRAWLRREIARIGQSDSSSPH
jgi:RNA polymerase sigma-70 factor (ECF subfamily)